MSNLLTHLGHSAGAVPAQDRLLRLQNLVSHAAHFLPAQGPIGVFIHHNTLHAFQHLPFEEAVAEAGRTYGTEPYMREEAFREQISLGRIQPQDIAAVLDGESNAEILPERLDRRTFRQTLLVGGQRHFDARTIRWHQEDSDLLQCYRSDLPAETARRLKDACSVRELYEVCLQATAPPLAERSAPTRPRDGFLTQTGVDLDEVIHPLLIRLSGAYLDQGIAYWPMPLRDRGFLHAVRALLSQPLAVNPQYMETLDRELRRQVESKLDAEQTILEMLESFAIPEAEWESALQAELLALPGWTGLFYRLQEEPELAPHLQLRCSLMEFLAVRMTLTAVAAAGVGKQWKIPLESWRTSAREPNRQDLEQQAAAARLFDAVQLLGITLRELTLLNSTEIERLHRELTAFDNLERRRVLHLAYERHHERQILAPLARHRQEAPPKPAATRPAAQVFFCIDEREESMRRHLEETDPEIETLSAAGFYGVAVDFCGMDDAHGVALCPVVIKPQHAVREIPAPEHEHHHRLRQTRRRLWSRLARNNFVSSRMLLRGWLSTAALGTVSVLPLLAGLLAPRQYARLHQWMKKKTLPDPLTGLTLVRADEAAPLNGLLQGFTITEQIDRVAGMLGPAGLKDGFARIVIILGHGSTSLNNPHESAHDCGACGGRRGGPNARSFAAMANHPDVRRGLDSRGIIIPDGIWFIGGYHDTCNDVVDLYDLDRVPATHRSEFQRVRKSLDRARALNAQERARRFEACSDDAGPDAALRHVEERSEYLAEPRPEYGHCTNAVCIVGRRAVTRGLFLDRRSFLISYDPLLDPVEEGLTRLLGAAVPVCAGISLEYYFSFVDNHGYGCGTKLPHNITGLVGVMNGHASDLRTGLPWQMVEIHEPVRILFVVETTPERLMRVISANAGLSELVENDWVRLAAIDPHTGEVHMRRGGSFELVEPLDQPLPAALTSTDWYRGKLEHLGMARICQ